MANSVSTITYESLVDRMVALCATVNYSRERCEQLVAEYVAQQSKGCIVGAATLKAVSDIIAEMEEKAANPNKGITKKLVTDPHAGFKIGELVVLLVGDETQCGVITHLNADNTLAIQVGSEVYSPVPFTGVSLTTPEKWLTRITEIANNFGIAEMVPIFHGAIAFGRDRMSYAVLWELNQKVWEVASKQAVQEEAVEDIFGALFEETNSDVNSDVMGKCLVCGDVDQRACPKCNEPPSLSQNAQGVESTTHCLSEDSAPDALASATVGDASNGTQSDTADQRPVYNDSGNRVDPETGEVELHGMLRALGWSEYPQVSNNPTSAEVENLREKVDQVIDIINTCRESATRYRNQAEARAKEKEDRADSYDNFIKPLQFALGRLALPRIKSGKNQGKLKQKTLHLPSGDLKFSIVGGWKVVHHGDLEKKLIADLEAKAVTKEQVYARQEWHFNWKKLLKDIADNQNAKKLPGVAFTPVDELGSVCVSKAKPAGAKEDDDIEEV